MEDPKGVKVDSSSKNCAIIINYSGKLPPDDYKHMSYIYAHGKLEDGYDLLAGNTAMINQFELFGAADATQRHITAINFNSVNHKDVNADLYMWKADYGNALVIKGLVVDPEDTEAVKYAQISMKEEKVFL